MRTFYLVFAYVYEGRRRDGIGREVVDHGDRLRSKVGSAIAVPEDEKCRPSKVSF